MSMETWLPPGNDKVCLWKMSPGLELSARVLRNSGLSQDCLHCCCLDCDHLKLRGQVGQGKEDSLPERGGAGPCAATRSVGALDPQPPPRLEAFLSWYLVWEDWVEGWSWSCWAGRASTNGVERWAGPWHTAKVRSSGLMLHLVGHHRRILSRAMSQSGSDFRSCVRGGWIGGIWNGDWALSEETVASFG